MVKPAVRREVAEHLQTAYQVSERRACRATGFHRSCQRYRKQRDPQVELRMRLKELAAARVRYGYRRLHMLLRREGWPVNHKRVYRLYREEGLSIRPKLPKRKRAWRYRQGRPALGAANEVVGDGLHVRPAVRRPSVPDPDGGRLPHARGACDSSESELPGLPRALVHGGWRLCGEHRGRRAAAPEHRLLPFKHNAARRHRIPRAKYRVRNWPAYDAGLRRRGDLTLWLDEATISGLPRDDQDGTAHCLA